MAMPICVDSSVPNLWKAREAGLKSVNKPWFPKLDQAYIDSFKSSFQKYCVQAYANAYSAIETLSQTVVNVTAVFFHTIYTGASYVPGFKQVENTALKVYNYCMPINLVNGQRSFNLFPRVVERWLGDHIFAPLFMGDCSKSFDAIGNEFIPTINNGVLKQLLTDSKNQEILNPEGQAPFDYTVFSSADTDLNAFAIPGGSMVVTSQIVKMVAYELNKTQNRQSLDSIRSIEVIKADGTKVNVDVTDVTRDDVLAALIGHEMTHIASRHGTRTMTLRLIAVIALKIFISYIANYAKDEKAPSSSYGGRFSLPTTRDLYSSNGANNSFLSSLLKGVEKLAFLYGSRQNEHEADITGAYLAMNAGYNPKGALYLQEALARATPDKRLWSGLDFISTHPNVEKRKTAIYTALESLQVI